MRNVKIIISVIMLILFTFNSFADYKDYQNTLGRRMSLRTTASEERYVYFYIKNNEIYAEGCFPEEYPSDVYLSGVTLTDYSKSISALSGGRFSAALSGTPTEDYGYIVVKFPTGKYLSYRMEYDNGWFFGDNGISESNDLIFENPRELPPDINAFYLSTELSPDDSEKNLKEINRIADEVTAGIHDNYQKAKVLSQWVSQNIYYDMDAANGVITPKTIELGNVLETRRTICAGYANLYAALLESQGIKTLNIKGGATNEECKYEDLPFITVEHEWIAFWHEKENRWVYTDPAWDSGNRFENGKFKERFIAMRYFDISSAAFAEDHRAISGEYRRFFDVPYYLRSLDSDREASNLENFGASQLEPTLTDNTNLDEADKPLSTTTPNSYPTSLSEEETAVETPYPKYHLLYLLIFIFTTLILVTLIVFIKNKLRERTKL